ncbi:retrovirus-related Pol polyprotein from transposon TNT 1-94, partial [Trifolium medium]|nr:retrovirus-related Pol polyprotein from transposon TNT 1-94 [Trifolium medium]
QLRAKARQLPVELRSTTLENRTVQEYLLRIRLLIDTLISIGDPLPLNQHLDVILEGLPNEFNSVISVIESKFDTIEMNEVEALLLAHEARLDKGKKKTIEDAASINIAQTTPNEAPVQDQNVVQPSVNNSYGSDPPYNPNFGGSRGRGSKNNRGRGGRNGGGRPNNNNNNSNTNTQCQICFKPNHTALECWHRTNPNFQPQNPSNPQIFPQTPPPGYFQEAYGPYSGQNFPPGFGRNFGYGFPNYNMWPAASSQHRPFVPFGAPTAMLANSSNYNPSNAWYPDSGASYHVTADAKNIQEQSPFSSADHIFMGNGDSLTVLSTGSSTFPSPNHTQTHLALHNLLHATKEILLQGNVGADGLYSFSNISIVPAKSSVLHSTFMPSVCSVTSKSA